MTDSSSNSGHRKDEEGHVTRPPSSRPGPSSWERLVSACCYGWVPEVASCGLAIASLVANFSILQVHNGRPLPEWPMGITINALISVFGVLLRIGVALPLSEGVAQLKWQWFSQKPRVMADLEHFDTASRGPWGAFLFLFRPGSWSHMSSTKRPDGYAYHPTPATDQQPAGQKHRTETGLNWLTKMSALLIVLSFAVDPFTQQILRYVPCKRANPSIQSTIPRSNVVLRNPDTFSTIADDTVMVAAVNNALTGPLVGRNVSSTIGHDCPLGNCTYPDFTTIAACHYCEDISSSIRVGSTHSSNPNTGTSLFPHEDFTIDRAAPTLNETMTLSGDGMIVTDATYPNQVTDIGITLITLNVLAVAGLDSKAKFPKTWADPTAFSCYLNPCLRTLRSTVTQFVLEEEEINRVFLGPNYDIAMTKQSFPWNEEDRNHIRATTGTGDDDAGIVIPEGQGGGAQQSSCSGFPEPGEGRVAVPLANVDASPPMRFRDPYPEDPVEVPRAYFPEHCVWYYEYYAFEDIGRAMTMQTKDLYSQPMSTSSAIAMRLCGEGCNVTMDSMNAFMADMADGVTAEIRNRGTASTGTTNNRVRGTSYETVTCVQVRWAWFSFPVAMVLLATAWLSVVIWQSPAGEVTTRGWKTSSLALLLAGVSEDKLQQAHVRAQEATTVVDDDGYNGGEEGTGTRTTKTETMGLYDASRCEMERLAEYIDVRLVRDEVGRAKFE